MQYTCIKKKVNFVSIKLDSSFKQLYSNKKYIGHSRTKKHVHSVSCHISKDPTIYSALMISFDDSFASVITFF